MEPIKQNQGLFISIEGPDGVGKSTVIELLKQTLVLDQYQQIVYSREPGGTKFGEQLRNLLLNSEELANDSMTTALLFIADRVDHLNKTILPVLKTNGVVIVDRYVDSTAIYQGYLKDIPVETIYALNGLATNQIMPDITFYLRADPEIIKQRSLNRENDSFDKVYLNKLHQMIEGFDLLAKQFPDRIHIIDASQTPEQVVTNIIQIIQNYGH